MIGFSTISNWCRIDELDRWAWAGLALVVALPLVAGILAADATMEKDEIRHFAYLHSLVVDGDLDLANEYSATYPKYAAAPWVVEATGLAPNESPIGPALLWLPGYLLIIGLGLDPGGLGAPARIAAVITSSAVASVGVIAAYALVRRRTAHPLIAVALVAGGSFYLYWWLWPGLYGHAIAIGLCGLYVWVWDRTLDHDEPRVWLGLGLLAGLITIVRWQNVILPAISIIWRWRRSRSPASALLGTALFGVGAVLIFSPQFFAWHVIYGDWLTNPQGSFMHWDKPYLLDTLMSPRYGLLGFSPLLYLGLIGILTLRPRRGDALAQFALVYVPVAIYINAAAGDWYAGNTFGPRRMDSLFVFLVVGSAAAIEVILRWTRSRPGLPVAAILGVAVVGTLLLANGYRHGKINRGMVGAHEFPLRAWTTIVDAIGWPPSLPAELFHMIRSGTRLGQYTALAHDDRLTWLDGEILPTPSNLGRGDWTIDAEGIASLQSDSGSIFLYLMDLGFHYRDIRVEIVLQVGARDRRIPLPRLGNAVAINGKAVEGSIVRDGTRLRFQADVPYAAWRPGINRIDFLVSPIKLMRIQLSRID